MGVGHSTGAVGSDGVGGGGDVESDEGSARPPVVHAHEDPVAGVARPHAHDGHHGVLAIGGVGRLGGGRRKGIR